MAKLTRSHLAAVVKEGRDAQVEKAIQLGQRIGRAGGLYGRDLRDMANLAGAFQALLGAAVVAAAERGRSTAPDSQFAKRLIRGRIARVACPIAQSSVVGAGACVALTMISHFAGWL